MHMLKWLALRESVLQSYDWLNICFTFHSRIFHYCQWRAAKPRPMLGAQGIWAGRDLYRAIRDVTRGLGFSGLIRRTAPFCRLLQHTRGCGGSILTRILITGPHSIASHDMQGDAENPFLPRSSQVCNLMRSYDIFEHSFEFANFIYRGDCIIADIVPRVMLCIYV
jgi:hypothetical protein